MQNNNFLPNKIEIKKHIISSLSLYWKDNEGLIYGLPVERTTVDIKPGTPLKLEPILLPNWAKYYGVNNHFLIPMECLPKNYKADDIDIWRKVDWFLVIFLLLECWHERLWENKYGPIHSYSFKLKGWDERAWKYAWVNRIGLFLREWAALNSGRSVESIFRKNNFAKINMTHDVDAIKKTTAIRLKQTVFIIFTAFRVLLKGNIRLAIKKIKQSFIFLFNNKEWSFFEELLACEKKIKIKSTFNFYSDLQSKKFKNALFDPNYKINSPLVKEIIANIRSDNHEIGLHPGFDSWNNIKNLKIQKKNLENILGIVVSNVRQHWLRFSWGDTWACQEVVGLKLDTTLMFNDIPGYRNSCALVWHPWNMKKKQSHNIKAMPTTIMDSHLYDYLDLGDEERDNLMTYWIEECNFIYGEMAILWHPHTLTKDYGWHDGFKKILAKIKK